MTIQPPAPVVTTLDMIPREKRICNGCGRRRLTTKHTLADGTTWRTCNDCYCTQGQAS